MAVRREEPPAPTEEMEYLLGEEVFDKSEVGVEFYGTTEDLEHMMRSEYTVPFNAEDEDSPILPEGILDDRLVEVVIEPHRHCNCGCMEANDPAKAHEVMEQIRELHRLLEIQPAIADDPDFRVLVARTCQCAEMVYDVLAIIDPGAEDMVFDLARQMQLEF